MQRAKGKHLDNPGVQIIEVQTIEVALYMTQSNAQIITLKMKIGYGVARIQYKTHMWGQGSERNWMYLSLFCVQGCFPS